MKLAYIIHGLYNSAGMERILTDKANALAEEYGYDITIITSEQKGRPIYFPLSNKVKTIDIGVNYHLPLFMRRLSKLLVELRPDFTISLCGGEMHALSKIKDGSVKVAELHFAHDRYYFRPGSGPIHDLIARRRTRKLEKAARSMDCFVVLTQKDYKVWQTISPGNLAQIYDFAEFDTSRSSELKNKHCICASRLTQSKNIPELVKAWKIVNESHPDWTLDIFGRGREEGKIRELIQKEGLEGKVTLHKPTKSIMDEMRASSIFAFTSLNEGFGLVLVEAASCGLPIVSYDCPCGPSEIVEDGKSGYLVKMHDVSGFAEKINSLIEDETLRYNMGKEAIASIDKFRKAPIIAQWDELFRKLKKDQAL